MIGVVSAVPTARFLRWRRASRADLAWVPQEAELRSVRMMLHFEATLYLPLIAFAAAMARGYGAFG